MQFDAIIMQTLLPSLNEFQDILECWDQADLKMHMETMIMQTWRSRWSQLGDTFGDCDIA